MILMVADPNRMQRGDATDDVATLLNEAQPG
jgi:hypothetical protein